MLYFDHEPMPAIFFPNQEISLDTEHLNPADRFGRNAIDPTAEHIIGLRFESNDDLIGLALLKGHLDDLGYTNVVLDAPYFPYSTMDHIDGDKSHPLGLRYVTKFINGLNFKKVRIMDPHSYAVSTLVDRIEVLRGTLMLLDEVNKWLWKHRATQGFVLVYPGTDAQSRYCFNTAPDCQLLLDKRPIIESGETAGVRYAGDTSAIDDWPRPCVITADLCRRGRTYVGCAEELRALGAQQIILCVAHLEESAFESIFRDDSPIDAVFATDSRLPHGFENSIGKLNLFPIF